MDECAIRLVLNEGKVLECHGPADITKQTTDAVVNAANSSLLGGGGVDGAIHRAGGPSILAECRRIVAQIGSLAPGRAVITTGGRLAARYVIHTVGPVYRDGRHNEAETLASCYSESIRVADEHGVQTLSFPSISTGAYGYPVGEAAPIAIAAAVRGLQHSTGVKTVRFVIFDNSTLQAYVQAAQQVPSHSDVATEKREL